MRLSAVRLLRYTMADVECDHANSDAFLNRVHLEEPLEAVLSEVVEAFDLGEVTGFNVITEGYENFNVRVQTSREQVLIKFFSKERTRGQAESYSRIQESLYQAGIPVPRPFYVSGSMLFEIAGRCGSTWACAMEFIPGDNFVEAKPSAEDIGSLSAVLAKLHNLSLTVPHNYDSWGTANFLEEFEKKRRSLPSEDLKLIQPAVDMFKAINFDLFQRCTIHGDLQRKHVLKDNCGTLTIIDFGCVDYNCAVIDVAISLALFCFDPISATLDVNLARLMLTRYCEQRPLSPEELTTLPLLIMATFAVYTLASSYLVHAKGDSSP